MVFVINICILSIVNPQIQPFEIQIEQMLKVLYDFDAEAGTELTVKEGDVLTILSKDAGDGWWNARLVFTFIRVHSIR